MIAFECDRNDSLGLNGGRGLLQVWWSLSRTRGTRRLHVLKYSWRVFANERFGNLWEWGRYVNKCQSTRSFRVKQRYLEIRPNLCLRYGDDEIDIYHQLFELFNYERPCTLSDFSSISEL